MHHDLRARMFARESVIAKKTNSAGTIESPSRNCHSLTWKSETMRPPDLFLLASRGCVGLSSMAARLGHRPGDQHPNEKENLVTNQSGVFALIRQIVAVGIVVVVAFNADPTRGQGAATTKRTAAQLEQLVAPIALYPDALLSQVLMASTYPLEVVAAARWSQANPNVTGEALQNALAQQP